MRLSTGVQGFDTLVEGGLTKDKLYLVSGPPGSGKTTFSAQFLTQGIRDGERGLFVSMHETKDGLTESMSRYSFDFAAALDSSRGRFINLTETDGDRFLTQQVEGDYLTSVQNQINQINTFVEELGIDRMVIDSTMVLRYFFDNDSETLIRFLTGLKQAEATTLLISEMTDPTKYADEHYLAHGVVFLHNFLDPNTGDMQRGLQVIKMRGTAIDTDIRKLEFTDDGVVVRPDTRIRTGRRVE